MKNIKLSIYLLLVTFSLSSMMSCQKDLEVQPKASLEKQFSSGKEDITIFMMINEDEVLVGTEGAFYAFLISTGGDISCGKISLQKYNSINAKWEAVANAQNMEVINGYASFSIDQASHSHSGDYRWKFVASGACDFNNAVSGSLALVVVDEKTEEEYPWE